jgi:hypothetical protein
LVEVEVILVGIINWWPLFMPKWPVAYIYIKSFEPCHDKTNIMGLRPAWIHSSLRIHAVWSGSMLFAISFSTCNRVYKRTAWILIRLRGCAGWSGCKRTMLVLSWHGPFDALFGSWFFLNKRWIRKFLQVNRPVNTTKLNRILGGFNTDSSSNSMLKASV